MCSWGHLPWWKVHSGENQSASSDAPAAWASAGKRGRRTDRGHRRHCLGESQSGSWFTARRQTRPIDQRNEIDRRGNRHDLMGLTDSHGARRTALLGIGKTDYRSPGHRRGRALRDHRNVVTVAVHDLDLRVDDRNVAAVAIQQPTEGRCKQPRSHRDKHFEGRLR